MNSRCPFDDPDLGVHEPARGMGGDLSLVICQLSIVNCHLPFAICHLPAGPMTDD